MVFSYYSDLVYPSNSVATLQVCKTVDALQCSGRDARLYLPVPWRYSFESAEIRLQRLRTYYGLADSFSVSELRSPVPLIRKAQRFPLTRRALTRIGSCDYGLLCVRNYWHLKMCLARGMRTLYETYSYRGKPGRTAAIIRLLNESPRFIGLIFHSELAREHWLSLGADSGRTTTIHNGMDESAIAATAYEGRDEARQRFGIAPDEKVIIYTGNTGRSKGVESVLDLACQLPEFSFHLVGCQHRDRRRLTAKARSLRLSNVVLRDWIPPSQVRSIQQGADALIIPPTANPLRTAGKTVLPIKTFEYLAAGVPLLAPRLEDTAELLEHEHNAFLLKPDDPGDNASSIRRMWADPDLRTRIAVAALKRARDLTWARRVDHIVAFAEEALDRSRQGRIFGTY